MKNNQSTLTEEFWDHLLSRRPDQILDAYRGLSKSEQSAVRDHLIRMSNEKDWHEEQRISAKVALTTITTQKGK